MTWEPIAGSLPQFAASGSAQAAAYVLKFYATGTTTPLTVSSTSTGSPTTTDFLLDAQGYLTLSAARVIPHVQTAYKLIMYLNQTDADADATGSAVWTVDNITLGSDITSLGPTIAQYASNGDYFLDSGAADAYILTVISAKQASTSYVDGEVITYLPDNTNTGASVVNRDGVGSADLKDEDGNALAAGAITAGEMYSSRYNLAATEFRQVPTVSLTTKTDLKSGRKNGFINGDFFVNQVGDSITPTANQYTSDQWVYGPALDGGSLGSAGSTVTTFTIGQTDGPTGNPLKYLNMAGSISGGSGSEQLLLSNRVESATSYSGEVVMLSFWVKGSAGGTISYQIGQAFGTGGIPSSANYVFNPVDVLLTTSWQKITKTFTMTSVSGKTLGNNLDDYMFFNIYKQLGATIASSLSGTAVNFSGSIDIADVQIERGNIATDFDRLHHADQLNLCRRYKRVYTVLSGHMTDVTTEIVISVDTSGMRSQPTLSLPATTFTATRLGGSSDTLQAPSASTSVLSEGGQSTTLLTGFSLTSPVALSPYVLLTPVGDLQIAVYSSEL